MRAPDESFCQVGKITLCYESFGRPRGSGPAADHGPRHADDRRRRVKPAYLLRDLAADAVGLLDHLEIEPATSPTSVACAQCSS
jgi:hypothetical protein